MFIKNLKRGGAGGFYFGRIPNNFFSSLQHLVNPFLQILENELKNFSLGFL